MCAERVLKIDIDDSQVKALLNQSPKIFNAEFNRGFSRTMGAFMRKFTKERLGKGGIKSRRRGIFSQSGGIFIPTKARKLGFSGRLENKKSLARKVASVRNSSPIAKAHEYGAVIRPKKGRFLFIGVKSVAKARRAGVSIPRGKKPKVLRVRSVTIKPRLGFLKTFRAFIPEAKRRLNESLQRAAKSAVKNARRAKKLRAR